MQSPAPRRSSPLKPEDPGAGRMMPPEARTAEDLSDLSVLVVEDDAANRKLAMLLLATAGARASGVESAEEALAAIAVDPPDIVIVDLVLPRMGGLVLIEEIRRRPAMRDAVLVAVTGLSGPQVERVVRASGCAAYVRKPIDTETFVATVSACLGRTR